MDIGRDFSSTSRKRKCVKIQDEPRSQIDPIPYFPNLHRQLHSMAASILVAYLEIHHPAPQDHPDAPVTIEADRLGIDTQTSRRTLLAPLSFIAVFWKNEEARARGARANREFLNPLHSRYAQIKPYSLTGSKTWIPGTTWLLRRNHAYLHFLLQHATPGSHAPTTTSLDSGDSHAQTALPSLGELIIGASMLGVDGRMTKAERLAGVLGKISK